MHSDGITTFVRPPAGLPRTTAYPLHSVQFNPPGSPPSLEAFPGPSAALAGARQLVLDMQSNWELGKLSGAIGPSALFPMADPVHHYRGGKEGKWLTIPTSCLRWNGVTPGPRGLAYQWHDPRGRGLLSFSRVGLAAGSMVRKTYGATDWGGGG